MFEFNENDNNLRTKLIKFLKLDIFFIGVQKQLKHHKEEIQRYRAEIQEYQKTVNKYKKQLEEMSLLALDHHVRSSSWGIICVNGNKPYVKFFEISEERNLREIQNIVQHLQPDKDRRVIDSPQHMGLFRERF